MIHGMVSAPQDCEEIKSLKFGLAGRDDRSAAFTEADSYSTGTIAVTAEDNLVAFEQEASLLSVAEADGLAAAPGKFQQAAARAFLRARNRPARQHVA
jgi:hypothetical protein